jgi:hypothetical protein
MQRKAVRAAFLASSLQCEAIYKHHKIDLKMDFEN